MSGETIVVTGTQKTLESTGATISNNALVQAIAASYDIAADGASFPDAEFVLTATYSVAPLEGATLALYARPLDVDGTADTEAPEITRPTIFIGTFTANNVTTPQTIVLNGGFARNVPRKADYYVHNNGTGQAVAIGWTLKVTPRSYKAAP
jgi:hypothetical protein